MTLYGLLRRPTGLVSYRLPRALSVLSPEIKVQFVIYFDNLYLVYEDLPKLDIFCFI